MARSRWQDLDPDDLEAHLVHADDLTAHGDVRGELIAVMAQRLRAPADAELAQREAELLRTHEREFLGPWVDAIDVTWHLGYWRRLRFPNQPLSKADVRRGLGELLGHPSARGLRTLELPVYPGGFEAIARLLCAAPRPHLRHLVVGSPPVIEGGQRRVGPYDELLSFPNDFDWGWLERLETLSLIAGRVRIVEGINLPHLQALTIGGTLPRTRRAIVEATWPALQRMSVGVPGGTDDLGADRFPVLRQLHVSTEGLGRVVDQLHESGWLARLTHLSLEGSRLGTNDVDPIVRCAEALRQLDELVLPKPRPRFDPPPGRELSPPEIHFLRRSTLTEEERAALERALPNARWV